MLLSASGSIAFLTGDFFSRAGANRLPEAKKDAESERQHHRARGSDGKLISPDGLLESIKITGRTSSNGFVMEMALNVHGQAVGGVVATRPIFLEALHNNPIQVAAEQMGEPGSIYRTAFGGSSQLQALQCA